MAWYSAIIIFRSRYLAQKAVGSVYSENHLGYGQFLAAIIWLLVVVEYAYFTYCMLSSVPIELSELRALTIYRWHG